MGWLKFHIFSQSPTASGAAHGGNRQVGGASDQLTQESEIMASAGCSLLVLIPFETTSASHDSRVVKNWLREVFRLA